MSILSGRTIDAAVAANRIQIDPYRRGHLNPASIDLTLGDKVRTYAKDPISGIPLLNVKDETPSVVRSFETLFLEPGNLYLLHTAERVWTEDYVPVLDGKSSIGRLGICVHLTAGYGDPGFNGQYTLEVTAVYPTVIVAGMRFCQMRFHHFDDSGVVGSYLGQGPGHYTGNYTGDAASGPVASKVWKQFR